MGGPFRALVRRLSSFGAVARACPVGPCPQTLSGSLLCGRCIHRRWMQGPGCYMSFGAGAGKSVSYRSLMIRSAASFTR
jgi:hypothetical protein